jgi:hypothetical protein
MLSRGNTRSHEGKAYYYFHKYCTISNDPSPRDFFFIFPTNLQKPLKSRQNYCRCQPKSAVTGDRRIIRNCTVAYNYMIIDCFMCIFEPCHIGGLHRSGSFICQSQSHGDDVEVGVLAAEPLSVRLARVIPGYPADPRPRGGSCPLHCCTNTSRLTSNSNQQILRRPTDTTDGRFGTYM